MANIFEIKQNDRQRSGVQVEIAKEYKIRDRFGRSLVLMRRSTPGTSLFEPRVNPKGSLVIALVRMCVSVCVYLSLTHLGGIYVRWLGVVQNYPKS